MDQVLAIHFMKRHRLLHQDIHAPLEQLGLCPQCGFGSSAMSKFNVLANPMNESIQRQKLERLMEAARRVWS